MKIEKKSKEEIIGWENVRDCEETDDVYFLFSERMTNGKILFNYKLYSNIINFINEMEIIEFGDLFFLINRVYRLSKNNVIHVLSIDEVDQLRFFIKNILEAIYYEKREIYNKTEFQRELDYEYDFTILDKEIMKKLKEKLLELVQILHKHLINSQDESDYPDFTKYIRFNIKGDVGSFRSRNGYKIDDEKIQALDRDVALEGR